MSAVRGWRRADTSGSPASAWRTLPDESRGARGAPRAFATTVPPVVWEGDFESLHSFAHVNRELVLALLRRGMDVRISPVASRVQAPAPASSAPGALPPVLSWDRYEPLRKAAGAPRPGGGHRRPVHVRHQWPPDFRRPSACSKFVLILPWEYGYLPSAWVGPVASEVDEVWAYSGYVRDCYVRSGLPAARVAVVPLGVDPSLFTPHASPVPIPSTRGYRFLFVGGAATSRKGFDVLLRAFVRAFRRSDDVCLVVKDHFYGPVTGEIAAVQADPAAPEVVYVYGDADPWTMPGYYTACDCLVLPYRAEGFCLPALEAMACQRPVIVTGHGAALDFCEPDSSYLIPAKEAVFPEMRVGDFPTCGPPGWAEPDEDALVSLLRHVFTHRDEAAAKAHVARARVLERFTWDAAAAEAIRRLGE